MSKDNRRRFITAVCGQTNQYCGKAALSERPSCFRWTPGVQVFVKELIGLTSDLAAYGRDQKEKVFRNENVFFIIVYFKVSLPCTGRKSLNLVFVHVHPPFPGNQLNGLYPCFFVAKAQPNRHSTNKFKVLKNHCL